MSLCTFLANLLLVVSVSVLLLRRLLVSMKTQRQMALDVRQAQEVQQVILPEGRTTVPGLVIESEYHPAREVGGDFFQIIPQPNRWQSADCGWRRYGQRTQGWNAGGVASGGDPQHR